MSQERADPSAKTSINWQPVCSGLDQLLLKWRQTIIDRPSAPFPQQWHLFSSYLRTCSSWWDQQYVWSTRDAVQLSREMMFYEVSSCATIWRESHLTILGDYLSQSSDPIHWKLSIFLGLEIAYSTAPFHRWRKILPLHSDSWIKVRVTGDELFNENKTYKMKMPHTLRQEFIGNLFPASCKLIRTMTYPHHKIARNWVSIDLKSSKILLILVNNT